MFPAKEVNNLEIIRTFPHQILDEPTVWIPLSDGVRLATRVWRPADSEREPVPAILEYIPYRRRDGRLIDDEQIHPYFAGHGFAGVRVDIRGSGDSEGLLRDEYLKQEQDDALEIIAWIAAQPWCDGNVGMMGLSWGGFNSLQVAARRPDALKAIIAVGATVDRYNDDVHYKNGCMLNEHFGWGSSFMSFCTRPPDPTVVGERWREMWLMRLDQLSFFPETWLAHPLRDDYWKHGSVQEDYAAIQIPVMTVTGWGDLYVNAVPRLLENLDTPCHALAGPWAHQYPHLVTPGPAIDFLGEAIRWWTQWLKQEETGLLDEPVYRAYVQEGQAPDMFAPEVAGRWEAVNEWPSDERVAQTFYLTANGLSAEIAPTPPRQIHSPVDTGSTAGELIPHCHGPEMPPDQRPDDAYSVLFDTPPLTESFDLWGDAQLKLTLKSDAPTGNLIVRLCDVGPDGASQLVTRTMLNLVNRESDEWATPMPIDQPVNITLALDHVAHRFPAGHRIRVALSTHYWPMVWPSPSDPTFTLAEMPATLTLPCSTVNRPVAFDPPRVPPLPNTNSLREASNTRTITIDQANRQSRISILDDYGEVAFADHGMINSGIKRETYRIDWGDPLSASAEFHWTQELRRNAWHVRTETKTKLTCDRENFYLSAEVIAYEGDAQVWAKTWRRTLTR